MNSFFLYQAGPEVETRMSRSRFLAFFVTNTLFVAVALWFLSPFSLTIGISGFCMALLAYLWIDLSTTRHPLAPQILTMLLINIAFGLFGGISFVGHLFGAIW
jgi:membrane associated rhomboid family serine protease